MHGPMPEKNDTPPAGSKGPAQVLLDEVDAFRSKHGLSEITFGRYAMKDGRLYDRIKRGKVSIESAQRVRDFMAGYVPKRRKRKAIP